MNADLNYVSMVISFIGGLGLFIYGMNVMATGLQKSAGPKMKLLLERITQTKLLGVLVGAGVTAIIQSSSATTVMVVGFVNAGLLNLSQSVGVIMGANIGTTITSWLVASVEWAEFLNPTTLAPIAVGVGAVLALFSRSDRSKQIGEMVVGFGILFIGMSTMTSAVSPLRGSQFFKDVFVSLGSNPLLAIFAGTAVTSIIQSSSASVGILQSIAAIGLVPFNAAVYIIMGQNIGTCVTAILSSIGASKNAKSAAYIHLLFNIIGSIVFSILAMIFFTFINPLMGKSIISLTEISIVHTSFNVASTILLYPFSNLLIFLAKKMAAVNENEKSDLLIHLDDRILETPSIAIESCVQEILRYAKRAMNNLKLATSALLEKDKVKALRVIDEEININALAQAITVYLVKLSNLSITKEQNRTITGFFHTVSDIERIGDYCENLAELTDYIAKEGLDFSEQASLEMKEFIDLTISCYDNAIHAMETGDPRLAELALTREEQCDDLEKEFRKRHIQRLKNYECNTGAGVAFLEALTNLERVSDHSQNIAEMVLDRRS